MKNFFLNIVIHYYIKSLRIRIAISVGSAIIYFLLFFPLFPLFGPSTGAFATIPVVVAAGLLGFHIGIFSGILALPLNTLLLNIAGIPGWDAVSRYGGGPPMFILIAIGCVVGLLHDLAKRTRMELIERKETEEALKKSEEKNRAILDMLPDILLRISRDGSIFDYRESKYGFPGIKAIDVRGKNILQILPRNLALRFLYYTNQALDTGNTQFFRYQLADTAAGSAPDPAADNIDMRSYDARILSSGQDEALFIVRDITEQLKADEARKNDILLKEIHHRIKNNLQIISSLLSLQSRYLHDKEDARAFRESQDRIKTMSLIHERLYQSRDLTRIDFSDYLRVLVRDLFYSYGIDHEIIRLEIDVEKIFFEIDIAIPCGLIINELMLNTIKYAFPDGRKGRVCISLSSADAGNSSRDTDAMRGDAAEPGNVIHQTGVTYQNDIMNNHAGQEKIYTLIISDDGVGIPAGFDIETAQSLGLKLVRTLTAQLEGTISIDTTCGTRFTIMFSLLPGE